MASPRESRGHLGQKVRAQVGDRRCPLCQAQAWDFAGTRVVFLVETERVRLEKIRSRLERTGSRLYREHPGQALIRELFKVFEEATRDNRLVHLSCNNCGHTELLDARKLDT
jgi:predicted nucleic-acid-binding Zn-ribbon protein